MEFFKKGSNVFKTLSEAVAEGIIVVNKKQQIVATNVAANNLFGYSDEELVGAHLNILIPKKFHNSHKKLANEFLQHHEKRKLGQERYLYGQHKDGSQFVIEVGLNPFTLFDNDYVMALVVDVTERKKAEQELNQWATIFNESLNEIYLFDANTLCFIDANKGAIANIGYTLEELKKMTPIDIKPGVKKKDFITRIAPLIFDATEKLTFNAKHKRKNGTTYPVEVHLQKSSRNDKAILVAIIIDITEREAYTQKLENTVAKRTQQLEIALKKEQELNQLKTKFLSLVSHEFKTPLSGIMTSATLAGKYTTETQQEKRVKHLTTIQSKVKYLNNIINDFLSIERLESGKVNYMFTHFPLSKVINEVVYDANMLLKDGQQIAYPENIDTIFITSDEKVLTLILTNLVNNAIKYSSENTTVAITAKEENNELTITLADEGMGIPEEEQPYIFNRYFRAENALHTEGTGIGLNIVKTHLENLGGTITFNSTLNIGSTFIITLPVSYNKKHEKHSYH